MVIHILRVLSLREYQNQVIEEWKGNRTSFWKFQYNQLKLLPQHQWGVWYTMHFFIIRNHNS